ncbi:MAG: T9SS type A sorting domain-containing protein, partial [Chitinophagaceae bacterium]
KYNNGANRLTWVVNNNDKGVQKYEVQRSDDFSRNYSTIGTVDPVNTDQANQTYTFNDPNQEFGSKKFYRIREVHNDGRSFYSKVIQVNNTEIIHFINKPKPNPFINELNVSIELLKANPIQLKITDASGRLTFQKNYTGTKGVNNLTLNNLSNFKAGIYFLEISSGSETIHEKIVKR